MSIDWHALGTVLVATLLSTVGLVGVFTLGISGLSRRADGTAAPIALRAAAYTCFAVCAAAVAWGLLLVVRK